MASRAKKKTAKKKAAVKKVAAKPSEIITLKGRTNPTEMSEMVHGELEAIRKKNSSKILQPIDVVNKAKFKTNPLHRFFEWDDGAAAQKFRLMQAGMLIKTVVKVIDHGHGKKTVSAYVNKSTYKAGRASGYEPTGMVVKRKNDRDMLIESKVRQLDRLRQEMEGISELGGVSVDIEQSLIEHGFESLLMV
jgi:hypothetical protein